MSEETLKVRVHYNGRPITFEITEGEDVIPTLTDQAARELGLHLKDAVSDADV